MAERRSPLYEIHEIYRSKLELIEHGLPGAGGHPGHRKLSIVNGQLSMADGARADTADGQYWRAADVTPFW